MAGTHGAGHGKDDHGHAAAGHDAHGAGPEVADRGPELTATPRPWQQGIFQARVRPQWDPAEVGRKFLDDMEKGGRLHLQKKKV